MNDMAFETRIVDGLIHPPEESQRTVAFQAASARQWWRDTQRLMEQAQGDSGGKTWTREDLHRG